jgi:esterase/lipase
MNTKNLSRITIDIPKADHKKLKTMAALQGKSMREIVVQSIKNYLKNEKSLAIESADNREFQRAVKKAIKTYTPLLKKLAKS